MSEIQSKDIYHGLPVISRDTKGVTAIVTGANGISDNHQLKVHREIPRPRPPDGAWPDHVEHISVDLLQSLETIAAEPAKTGVHVFFFTYAQPTPKDGEELGAEYYGLHRGPTSCPQVESDPRVLTGANFYYAQEDHLQAFAKKHQIGWNTIRPSHIAGTVPDAAMNLCEIEAWEADVPTLSARANGYLAEWIVLTEQAKSQSFNVSDDRLFTRGKFRAELAERFRMPWTGSRYERQRPL
ncbi:hypothetical protein N7449_000463 [Penicillium cf. viridicatum]|uniref:NAD(P)-binding domain-containing protein n=1 Tax=Penicillium cf. viridicatum TaxID=2972119 RepID=A0A9W9N5U1_9EURO|nr:hypothetical protein N7449_000463 [Penicillium cf. viridicatum]